MPNIEPRDVIGPLPSDQSALIVLRAGGKMFPVQCSMADADACYRLLKRRRGKPSVYDFIPPLFDAMCMSPIRIALVRRQTSLYSSIDLKGKGRKRVMRISSDNPAIAINLSLCSGVPLYIPKDDLDCIRDSCSVFFSLKKNLSPLWPLGNLYDTKSIQALVEYMDEALPTGSVFNGARV